MVSEVQNKILKLLNVEETEFKQVFINAKSLRLTRVGRNKMVRKFDSWTFEEHGLKTKAIIDLQRKMVYPYFLDKKMLVLFTERDAFMAKLAGAEGWIDGKS